MGLVAIIPARSGSKGIFRKNIYPINGQPLLKYTIESAIRANCVSKIIVSSDDEEILNLAKEYGVDTIIRPIELSSDTATSESVIRHVLLAEREKGIEHDQFILLQPTSPLRTFTHINKAYDLLNFRRGTSLISVVDFGNKPYKCFIKDSEDKITGLINNKYPFMRRQDLPSTYLANGAIYIAKTEFFLRTNSLYQQPCIAYVMDKESSIDIDTIEDIKLIEEILRCKSNE